MSETPKPTVGQRVFCERTADLTTEQIGEALGVHSAVISRWKRALRRPDYDNRKKIEQVFHVPADDWSVEEIADEGSPAA